MVDMASKGSIRVEDATHRHTARADAKDGRIRVVVITQLARFNNDLVGTRRDYTSELT